MKNTRSLSNSKDIDSKNTKKSKRNIQTNPSNEKDIKNSTINNILDDFKTNIKNVLKNDKDFIEENTKISTIINNKKKFNINLDKDLYNQEYIDNAEIFSENLSKPEIKSKFFGLIYDDKNEKKFSMDKYKISKIKNISNFKIITPLEIYFKHEYEKFHKISTELDKCSICLFEFYNEMYEKIPNDKNLILSEILNFQNKLTDFDCILFDFCNDHFFHTDCIINMIGDKEFIKCPMCNCIYGKMTGDQPPGKMTVKIDKYWKCEGYEKYNTIVIQYDFAKGKDYWGTSRTAYLPDNLEGREVLGLLRVGFERKLLFTIGTSVTTGQHNQTIWNGIHHKTSIHGGVGSFGYPDETYLTRVK